MDVSDQTSVATSTPQQAAANIGNATVMSVSPTNDKAVNDQMAPQVDQLLRPTVASPAVADYIKQSTEHTALAMGADPANPGVSDLPVHSFMDDTIKYVGDLVYNRPTENAKKVALYNKKMDGGGTLSDEDTAALWQLEQDSQGKPLLPGFTPEGRMLGVGYGGNDAPSWPVQLAKAVGEGVLDTGRTLRKNWDLISAATLAGAGAGLLGGPLAEVTVPGGAAVGFGLGLEGAFATDGYTSTRGSVYGLLDNMTDSDGNPMKIDENTKRYTAEGAGLVGAALFMVKGDILAKAIPILNPKITPALAKMAMQAPENAVMRIALQRIGRTMVTMGGVGALQQASNIFALEFGKHFDGTPASVIDALTASAGSLENWSQVGQAGAVNAITGGVIAGIGQAAGVRKTRAQVENISEIGKGIIRDTQVTMGKPAGLIGDPDSYFSTRDGQPGPDAEPPRAPPKDVTPIKPENSMEKAIKVLKFEDAMNDVTTAAQQTKMQAHAPQEMSSMMQKFFERAGLSKLYTTYDSLRRWATSDEKGEKARNLIDPSGILAGQRNAPFEVDPVKVAELAHDDPKIWGHVQLEPDGPTGVQAKLHLENVQAAIEKRGELMQKLGIEPKDVAPDLAAPDNVVPIGAKEKANDSLTPEEILHLSHRVGEIQKAIEENKSPPETVARSEGLQKLLKARHKLFTEGLAPSNSPEEKSAARESLKDIQNLIDKHPDSHLSEKDRANLEAEIETIKSKVANHLKEKQPGDLLIPQFGQWPEPSADDANKVSSDYINEPTFTEAIEKVLPKVDVQKFNIAQQNARKSVVDNIKETALAEMTQVQDVVAEMARDERMEIERQRIINDPNYAIVDKIHAANKEARKTKTPSIYSVDPKTLTKDQLKFVDHFRLKEHAIFHKGGSSADEVAQLLGLPSGENMLAILAKTPTREQVAKARASANAIADQKSARESVDPNYTRAIEALSFETANHIAEMKFMREQEWPATKIGIKKIALPLPKIEELTHQAKSTIAQTKVGSLNAHQYAVGEKKSNRIAINAILKNEVSKAFVAKEKAALNAELVKETAIATKRVNSALTFMRKMQKASSRAVLRQGGKEFVAAMQELQSLFNFRRTKAPALPVGIEQGPAGDYLKWATTEVKAGRGDFSIPDRLTEIKQSYKDMTVEQLLVVTDRARVIFNEAKLNGQLIHDEVDAQNAEAEYNVDRIAENFVQLAKEHPNYTPGNIKPVQGERHGWNKLWHVMATPEELLAAKQNIIRELDKGLTGGYFHKTLDEEFEGSGKHYEKSGFTYLKKVNKWIDGQINNINKAHGDPFSLEGKFLDIPEFHGIPELNNGRLTKGDLLAAAANRGQQYTKDMLMENTGGVSDAVWQTVLDRELETKDVHYVQSLVDIYKHPVIRNKTIELQARDGREVDFIEGVPYVHRGITYPGGYIRVRTVHDYTQADVKKMLATAEGKGAAYFEKDEGAKWAEQYAAQTTHQGYLVSRTSNKEPIRLSLAGIFDGLREIAHDHAYREPLRNFFSVMDHPDVVPALISMVGEKKVNTLISTALEIAGRPNAKDNGYFTDANKTIKSTVNKFGGKFASSVIWGNMSATIRQLESLPEVFNILGPKAMLHFAHVNALYIARLDLVHGFIQSAVQLDPNLQKYVDGVNDNTASMLDDLVPKKGFKSKVGKSLLGRSYDLAKMIGFLPHQAADAYLKAVFAHTIYKHVMAGDHPNYPKETLAKMTEQEQFQTVQSIIQQMSALSQIQNREELKAPIQKNLAMKPYTYFWNYPRNVINNTIMDARRATWKTKEGLVKLQASGGGRGGGGGRSVRDMQEGNFDDGGRDFRGAMNDFAGAGNIALSRFVWNTLGGLIAAVAAGKTIQFLNKKVDDWKNPKEVEDAGMSIAEEMMKLNFERTVSTIPIVSSINYALSKRRKYQMAEVQDPHGQALSSIATCIPAITDMLTLSRNPRRMQQRACLEAESYVFVTAPVRGYLKATEWMNMHSLGSAGVEIPSNFKANFNTAQVDKFEKHLEDFKKDPGEASKDLVAEADAIHKQIAPAAVNIPADAADTVKMAESGGQWQKENGLYGFTKSDWKEIMRSAPELGLTENGRIAKDTTQQEKAIDWSLHNNASQLAAKDIPVNNQTLYGTHVLGVTNYEKVFNAPADAKVKTVLGGDELKEHPELQNFKTIGQVKTYLNSKVASSRKANETLTSTTSQNED